MHPQKCRKQHSWAEFNVRHLWTTAVHLVKGMALPLATPRTRPGDESTGVELPRRCRAAVLSSSMQHECHVVVQWYCCCRAGLRCTAGVHEASLLGSSGHVIMDDRLICQQELTSLMHIASSSSSYVLPVRTARSSNNCILHPVLPGRPGRG